MVKYKMIVYVENYIGNVDGNIYEKGMKCI